MATDIEDPELPALIASRAEVSLPPHQQYKIPSPEPEPDMDLMEDYLSMGFSEDQVRKALRKFRGRLQQCIEFVHYFWIDFDNDSRYH